MRITTFHTCCCGGVNIRRFSASPPASFNANNTDVRRQKLSPSFVLFSTGTRGPERHKHTTKQLRVSHTCRAAARGATRRSAARLIYSQALKTPVGPPTNHMAALAVAHPHGAGTAVSLPVMTHVNYPANQSQSGEHDVPRRAEAQQPVRHGDVTLGTNSFVLIFWTLSVFKITKTP